MRKPRPQFENIEEHGPGGLQGALPYCWLVTLIHLEWLEFRACASAVTVLLGLGWSSACLGRSVESRTIHEFLGPPPGTEYVVVDSEGSRFQVTVVESGQRAGALEFVFRRVGENDQPPQVLLRYVQSRRLVQETPVGGEILLEEPIANSTSWSSPVLLSRSDAGDYVEARCEIVDVVHGGGPASDENARVTVECGSPFSDSSSDERGPEIEHRRVFEEGFGIVQEEINEVVGNERRVIYWQRLERTARTEGTNRVSEGSVAPSSPPQSASVLQAAEQGDAEELSELLRRGGDTNARGPSGYTPLMMAAYGGSVETMRLLLTTGADIDAQADNGGTALIVATIQGHLDVVRLLVEAGATTDTRVHSGQYDGLTAEMIAEQLGEVEIARLLQSPPE